MEVNIQKNHAEAETISEKSVTGQMRKKKIGAIGKVFDSKVLEIDWICRKSIPYRVGKYCSILSIRKSRILVKLVIVAIASSLDSFIHRDDR